MKNPLASLAKLLVGAPQSKKEHDNYEAALTQMALPLGEYLSDEFDSVEDLFDYLKEEDVLPKETISLLKHNKEFCKNFAEGLKRGQEDEYEEDEYEYDEKEVYDEEDYLPFSEDEKEWEEGDYVPFDPLEEDGEDDEDEFDLLPTNDEEDEDIPSFSFAADYARFCEDTPHSMTM